MSMPLPYAGAWRDVDGIVLLDKPEGISSNAALQRVRRAFRARKAGHTGSLDPLASGMLPVCLGQATKASGMLLDADKTYRFRLALGRSTSTGDREGKTVETAPAPALDEATVGAMAARFVGESTQVPPMYSALKHDGRRLYRLARAGIEIIPSVCNFVVVRLRDVEARQTALAALAHKGVLAMPLSGYGMPEALHITIGTEAANRAVAAALTGDHQ